MEQETTAPEGAAFEPRPMTDILRDAPAAPAKEPAGRPEPVAAPPEPVETGEKPDAQPTAERPRDEAGRFAPKAGAPDTGPPPEAKQDAPQSVPIAAVLEERKKRQALERQLQELQARMTAPPAPPQMPHQPAEPDIPIEDLMFSAPDKFVERVQAPLRKQVADMQLLVGEMIARQQPDYAAAEQAVFEMLDADPQAKAQVAAFVQANPMQAPQWVLHKGRELLAQKQWGPVIQQYGSPEAFIAAQRPSQPAPVAQPSAPPAPPASLASIRSAGPRTAPAWSGPTPLRNILGTRR